MGYRIKYAGIPVNPDNLADWLDEKVDGVEFGKNLIGYPENYEAVINNNEAPKYSPEPATYGYRGDEVSIKFNERECKIKTKFDFNLYGTDKKIFEILERNYPRKKPLNKVTGALHGAGYVIRHCFYDKLADIRIWLERFR